MARIRGKSPHKALYTIDGFEAPAHWWARLLGLSASTLRYHMRVYDLTFEEAYEKLKKAVAEGWKGRNLTYKPEGKTRLKKEKSGRLKYERVKVAVRNCNCPLSRKLYRDRYNRLRCSGCFQLAWRFE